VNSTPVVVFQLSSVAIKRRMCMMTDRQGSLTDWRDGIKRGALTSMRRRSFAKALSWLRFSCAEDNQRPRGFRRAWFRAASTSFRIGRLALTAIASLPLLELASARSAFAAEGGASFYVLGQRGPLAGVTPPPGVYFQNSLYVYGGDSSASHSFQLGGNVAVGLKATVVFEVPALLWVTPATIFGGSLGFTFAEPIGSVTSSVNAVISGPLGVHHGVSVGDTTTTFGDPVFGALIGWNAGNFHWQIAESVNVPIGDYRDGALANVSLNRWVGDTTLAATWLDPAIGVDVTGAVGITFNGENPATEYRTGTEFHLEGSVTKYLSKEFFIGPAGYFYGQITGDSGSGNKLGPYEGRVAGLGAVVGYTFDVGKIPVSATVSVYREFDVIDRLEGTAGWLTLAVPLWVSH
jgi:hypothetical protein